MKKTNVILTGILFFLLLTFSFQLPAQTSDWVWAKSAGGSGYEDSYSVAADPNGNVYVTGRFFSPTFVFGNDTLTNAGSGDVFLAKYDASGNVIWAKSAGGSYSDDARCVVADANGNVYVTGRFFSPTIVFGNDTLTNTDKSDIFLAKYDASGNVIWAQSAGGSDYDDANSVATDANGNVYVTGAFDSPIIIFGNDTLTNAGRDDIFLAKYDASGNVLWAKSAGKSDFDYARNVAADVNGYVYVTGYFSSPAIVFGNDTLTNEDNSGDIFDIFLAKYDASGNVLWAKSAGGSDWDYAESNAADANGNVYVTGRFNSSSIVFGNYTLTNAGSFDIFLAKYDASGNVLWAKSTGGSNDDYARSVAADANGNVCVTGYFYSLSIVFGNDTLNNAGWDDIFLAKYDASGNVLWAKSAGGSDYDEALSVTADANSNVYVTGYFSSPTVVFGNDTLTNAGPFDIFLAKLSDEVGIQQLTMDIGQLLIYPNPASQVVEVSWHSAGMGKVELSVYDMMGKLVYNSSLIVDRIDVSSLNDGIYFIKLTGKDYIRTGKFVKQ